MSEQPGCAFSAELKKDGKATCTLRVDGDVVYVDVINLAVASQRERFIKEAQLKVPGIDHAAIEKLMLKAATEGVPSADAGEAAAAPSVKDDPETVAEAEKLLSDPKLLRRVLDDVKRLGVAGEQKLVATTYLVGTSRKLQKPLAKITQGPSSSGKSYVDAITAKLFPPEDVIFAHQMTPQALFHMPPGSLKHKFVVAGERSRVQDDDRAEATRALREMLSSGHLSKLMPVKSGNGVVTEPIEQEGPIAYVETTTLQNIFDEDANRCIIVSTDETPEQTKRVIRQTAARAEGGGLRPDTDAR